MRLGNTGAKGLVAVLKDNLFKSLVIFIIFLLIIQYGVNVNFFNQMLFRAFFNKVPTNSSHKEDSDNNILSQYHFKREKSHNDMKSVTREKTPQTSAIHKGLHDIISTTHAEIGANQRDTGAIFHDRGNGKSSVIVEQKRIANEDVSHQQVNKLIKYPQWNSATKTSASPTKRSGIRTYRAESNVDKDQVLLFKENTAGSSMKTTHDAVANTRYVVSQKNVYDLSKSKRIQQGSQHFIGFDVRHKNKVSETVEFSYDRNILTTTATSGLVHGTPITNRAPVFDKLYKNSNDGNRNKISMKDMNRQHRHSNSMNLDETKLKRVEENEATIATDAASFDSSLAYLRRRIPPESLPAEHHNKTENIAVAEPNSRNSETNKGRDLMSRNRLPELPTIHSYITTIAKKKKVPTATLR